MTESNSPRKIDVFFYVQHLLGIGHQKRAATLTRAMERAGLKVAFVSGGQEVPGLDWGTADFFQLPPLKADGIHFTALLTEEGLEADEVFKQARTARLLALYEQLQPRLVLLEMYPFGRRQMRFELLPLLEAAKASAVRPLIVSSVRDILVKVPKPSRLEEMLSLVRESFDSVLIHGDPELIPFDRTFEPAREIESWLSYTGYVVDEKVDEAATTSDGRDEVLVSTGGGAVSERLVSAALEACRLARQKGSVLARKNWRLLVGHSLPEARFRAFVETAEQLGASVVVERSRADFTSLLKHCAVSLSQGGYNTIMETLRAGCPRVVVPYSGGLETEQTLRAALLAESGALINLDEETLSGKIVLDALEQALAVPQTPPEELNTSGAETTARLLQELLDRAGAR
ncbi:glycosyltransferase family protein [Kiloniella sp. b19]|uniref:glycosyltransferase family protein n=1 Tax=Kiloniella sp. GXU_MW_B19 TaxID=3141326 RepID=UPI0031D73B82